MWLISYNIAYIIGVQTNSMCGYKLSYNLLKLNNFIYSKPSCTNTLYSTQLTCIDTTDYTIIHNFIHLEDLRNSLDNFKKSKSFQKPVFNYVTEELEDFEFVRNTDNLLVYGPDVNKVVDLCDYTIYMDFNGIYYEKCNFIPDYIIHLHEEYVIFFQKNEICNGILCNYDTNLINYDKYYGLKISLLNDLKAIDTSSLLLSTFLKLNGIIF